jgi:hypothetical protein
MEYLAALIKQTRKLHANEKEALFTVYQFATRNEIS